MVFTCFEVTIEAIALIMKINIEWKRERPKKKCLDMVKWYENCFCVGNCIKHGIKVANPRDGQENHVSQILKTDIL